MNVARYVSGKLRKAGTRIGARVLLDILDDLEADSHKRTHELDVFNSGIKVNLDVAERKLYGAIRKAVERKAGIGGPKVDKQDAKVAPEKKPGLDPDKEV